MTKLELVQAWQAEMPAEQASRVGYKDSGIFHLQLTPDDRYALTLNFQYRELIVWDFQTGQRLFSRDWRGYNKVRDLYLTPDGNYAVVIGETGGVVPLSPGLPDPPKLLPREDYAIVNARSKRAISSNGRQARVWDFEKQYFTVTLEIPAIHRDDDTWDPLRIHSISNNGKLGSGMFDNHVLIWDMESGKVLWHWDFGKQAPNQTLFTPDEQQIVLKFISRLETWRWSTDRMDGPAFNTHAGRRLHSPVFTPDGQTLITGSDDGTIQVWDWPNGYLKQVLAGHRHQIKCLSVSADGEYLASTGEDTTLRKWHILSGKQVFSTLRDTKQPEPTAIDPSGRYVICPYGCDKATLAIYDLANGILQRILKDHDGDINAMDFLSKGRLVSASDDHTLRIWNLESGECLQTLSGVHTSRVQAVVVIPNHDQVVSAAADGRIIRWDLATGLPARPPLGYTLPTSWTKQYLFMDQRGHWATIYKAGANDEQTVPILLDLESGRELPTDGRGVLSPSGHWLINMWDHIKITNLNTQKSTIYKIGGRLGDLWCFTPDEQALVSTYELGKIVLIDLKSGAYRFPNVKPAATRPGNRITALALSPDGQLGAIATDESVRIWDISTGEELVSLNAGQIFFTLVFDPHNRYLLAGGYNIPLCCFELRALSD